MAAATHDVSSSSTEAAAAAVSYPTLATAALELRSMLLYTCRRVCMR